MVGLWAQISVLSCFYRGAVLMNVLNMYCSSYQQCTSILLKVVSLIASLFKGFTNDEVDSAVARLGIDKTI